MNNHKENTRGFSNLSNLISNIDVENKQDHIERESFNQNNIQKGNTFVKKRRSYSKSLLVFLLIIISILWYKDHKSFQEFKKEEFDSMKSKIESLSKNSNTEKTDTFEQIKPANDAPPIIENNSDINNKIESTTNELLNLSKNILTYNKKNIPESSNENNVEIPADDKKEINKSTNEFNHTFTETNIPTENKKEYSKTEISEPTLELENINPIRTENKNVPLKYKMPPKGKTQPLTLPEIRWCLREDIRINTMREIVSNSRQIEYSNQKINNYNERCSSYKYHTSEYNQAESEINEFKEQIVNNITKRIKNLSPEENLSNASNPQ